MTKASHSPKLRVGLFLGENGIAAWAFRMIEIIEASDYAEIVLLVRASMPAAPLNPVDGTNQEGIWTSGFRKLLRLAEQRLVGKPGQLADAFRIVDEQALLEGIDAIRVQVRGNLAEYAVCPNDIETIKKYALDVLVQANSGELHEDILEGAKFGLWSCVQGDGRSFNGGREGYLEVMESRPETGSMLRIAKKGRQTIVAYRSYSSTHPMSVRDNRSNVQWKTLHFVPRMLKTLYRQGGELFMAQLQDRDHPSFFLGPGYHDSTSFWQLFGRVCAKACQKFKRKWISIFYFRQWFLLYDLGEGMSTALWRFKHLLPPKDRFWADPFVMSRDGKYYIFIEEFLYSIGKGHISLIVLNKDGSHEPPVRILETPYHLSYPFTFEFEGELYMIPESASNRTIDLYKCASFPCKWEFQKHIMKDVQALDATLFNWGGKWWMFANQVESRGASTWDELHLYFADNPLVGNWTPHPGNPVVSDVRRARPAGRLFVRNGNIYRPSQNCAGHYGYGFNLNRIIKLTETEYVEEVVERVEPVWDKNVISTHTFNYEDGLTIIDGQLQRRK